MATAPNQAVAAAAPAVPPAEEPKFAKHVPEKDKELLFGKHDVPGPSGMYYKPGKGLVIESKNKLFKMVPRLRIQMRETVESEKDDEGDRELSQSFQLRRARLQFVGHVFGKHNKYKVEFAFSPRDIGLKDGRVTRSPLLTWYVEFDYLRDFTLRAGQYKIPYSRQRVVSSGDLEMVDRTMAQGEFNLDRDIGIDVRSKDLGGWGGRLRYYAGVYVGEGRDGYNLEPLGGQDRETGLARAGGLMYLGRLEFLPMGKFKDYSETDFKRSKKPRLSIGLGYAFLDEAKKNRGILGSTPADEGTTDYHNFNADMLFKWSGATLLTEFYWRRGARVPGDAVEIDDMGVEVPIAVENPRNGLGWTVQLGYLLPRTRFGVAARYSQVRPIGTEDETSLVNKDEVGGALSYYIAGHPLKVQLDYFHQRPDWSSIQANDIVRLQLQLAY